MQNEATGTAAKQASPSISADFLVGSTELGLDRIRTRLLDLTNRNKLLNFRHTTASSLRVVAVSIDQVFKRLKDNEKLSFRPVPEPDIKTGEVELPSARECAEQLGWNTSYDLDEPPIDIESDRYLPVLHYPEHLDTLSRKISSIAKTAIEESGTNMLYLILGFLEWYESDDSKQPRIAPLVTLPVTLERNAGRGKIVESVIEDSGEDIETNLSLAEKMRRDFGLELPVWEDEDTPERYFAKFAEILQLKKRWRIRRQITLALLSFGKLLMYRDLDPKTWPTNESIAKHTLVRELFEGTKNADIALAEEYAIDAPELKPLIPHLIRDADSSQHSALVHALSGQSLVIEGPPGTGKSQTITNLIAAVLAKGKTVLFVSEKLAALEVVRRRLDDAGLGMFCLELHSHKTKKGALLNDIALRHNAHGTFREPRELDRHIAIAEEKKQLLTRYVSLINTTIEPFNATIFEILWARDRCGQDISSHRDDLGHLTLPQVIHYTKTEFTQTEQFLSVYTQHLTAVLNSCDSIERHPWAWIGKPLSFEEEERILGLLQGFLSAIQEADETCQLLEITTGIALTRTLHGLDTARVLVTLPEPGGLLIEDLLESCQAGSNRKLLEEFVRHSERYRANARRLSMKARDIGGVLDEPSCNGLLSVLQHFRDWGIDGHSVAEIRKLRNTSTEIAKLLTEAQSSFRSLLSTVGCEAPADLAGAALLLATIRLIEIAPFEQLQLRQPALEGDSVRPILEIAQEEARALKSGNALLSKEFDLSLGAGLYSPAQLSEGAEVLEKSSIWRRIFGRDYRRAVKLYRRIALNIDKVPRTQMILGLRAVAEHVQKRTHFDTQSTSRELLGVHFKGVDSPWEEVFKVLQWYEEIFAALPEHHGHADTFRRILLSARSERLKAINTSVGGIKGHTSSLDQIIVRVNELAHTVPGPRFVTSGSFGDICTTIEALTKETTEVLEAIDRTSIADDVTLRDIPGILAIAGQCRNDLAAVHDARELPTLIGAAFRGVNTDLGPIKNTLQFAQSIASGTLPQQTVTWLLCHEYEVHLSQLRNWLTNINDCACRLQSATKELAAMSGSALWSESTNDPWGNMQALAHYALASHEELPQWNHFLRLRIKSREDRLDKLTALADSQILDPRALVPAYHFVFYNTLSRSVFAQHPDLSQITGVTQELIRQQFATADKEAIRLYSERVAAIIDQRATPHGNHSGPVRTWTDMALIINEINKQKRHIPIRQLVRRSGKALLALKPCFMMGPLSVAQYLAPGQLKFDLVVMDEASQLKPEDAIGALARGGQVVIVGDPKQLPPTTFFQRVMLDTEDDSDEDPRTAVEEGESILDVASTLFQPVRRLRWHYRSRHHSLIAFSNNEFYGDLVIFPSAFHDDPALGVKHHFVPDGMFENSRNPSEAAVVVEAVIEHMRDHPQESLGVVTLNFEQRELVEEMLDRRLRDDPVAVAYQERMTGGQETFFVKNLENVQGDERDVIFISTTYGPDARGNQYQRFGPINGPNGHRRLNVLFTRAKKRILVFSSLDPERIQTTANSPWGVRALKQYLIFARTGVLQQADEGSSSQPTNDFEQSVGTVLKEKGYEVVPQVGVAGFFIDLGVRHPAKAGTFLLGIECDGATYHSGRSARDRDRLREEILVNLGWKIHRIWSTDWFKSRDSEVKRLLRRIDDLLVTDPAFRAMKDKTDESESLRQRLIKLRETEIKPAFPDSPLETGLLRKSLLDEFVRARPKTRDEWFRKVPQHLRISVDSKQVGKYLDRVLEIIAGSEE